MIAKFGASAELAFVHNSLMVRSQRLSQRGLTAVGFLFVGLGIVGYILPLMPGTIFFILALACFRRGDSRFEHNLLANPRVGPTLRNWDEHGAIKPRTKILAITLVWLTIGGSCFGASGSPWIVVLLLTIAACLTAFIASRPSVGRQESYS